MNMHLSSNNTAPWLYLLFWPVFVLRYLLIEQYSPPGGFHPVSCGLDQTIPFWEGFVIPYFVWYVLVAGSHLWLCFRDAAVFRRYSRYLLISCSISTAVFLFWPSCQNLRPEVFPRENLFVSAVAVLYRMDTSTNVCPSEHVIGAVGFFLAAMDCEKIRIKRKPVTIGLAALLMAVSTVFLKQHSILDVLAALPVCLVGYFGAFFRSRLQTMSWSTGLPKRYSA